MTTIHTLLDSALVQRLGWTLLHFLWQGALVAALGAIGLRCLRRAGSSARYLWLLTAFAALALAPTTTLTLLTRAPSEAAAARRPIANESIAPASPAAVDGAHDPAFPAGPPAAPLTAAPTDVATLASRGTPVFLNRVPTLADHCRPVLPWLVAAWAAGVSLLTLRLAGAWWRLRRLITRDARPLAGRWATLTSHMCDAFDVRRRVQFLESRRADVPIVISWLRPVVVVPTSIMTNLTPAEVEALLAHELAHIRRWDDVVNLLQTVVETLLFYHPAVWWLSARLRQEREHCCDDLAAEMIGDRLVYSRALLAAAQVATSSPEKLAVAATGGNLSGRIRRLVALDGRVVRPAQPQSRWPVIVVTAMLFAVLALLASRPAASDATAQTRHVTEDSGTLTSGARPAQDSETSGDATPLQIIAGIEQAMRRFRTVEYTAEYGEQRDANAFRGEGAPLLLEGSGRYTFRTDGRRWFADEHGFTYTVGTTDIRPTRAVSGFDGVVHFVREGEVVTLGEDHLAVERRAPEHVFWEVGRNWNWLEAALNDPSARIVDRPVAGGHPCVAVHSKWAPSWAKTTYVFDVLISPQQSFLPLKCTITEKGQLEDEWEITEVAQTTDGTWYPRVIETRHRRGLPVKDSRLTVTSLTLRGDFQDDDFNYPVPAGVDVVDYPRGSVYFNDPWQPDLGPWMRAMFDVPAPWIAPTDDIGSHCDGTVHGQPAPAIEATEWINGDPGPWSRPGRQFTVLFFFGGRLISPTPRWLAGLQAVQRKYGVAGVELMGVASASSGDDARQTARELGLAFPIAVAAPSERPGSSGRPHDAFGLPTYTGVFVIDPQGFVHVVKNPQPAGDAQLALEPLLQKLLGLAPEEFTRAEDGLSIEAWRETIAQWRRLRAASPATGQLAGNVMYNHPLTRLPDYSQVEIALTPHLRVVSGHTVYGHTVHSEDNETLRIKCDRDGRFAFDGLRKGTFTLTVSAANYQPHQQLVAVAANTSSPDAIDVRLNRNGANP